MSCQIIPCSRKTEINCKPVGKQREDGSQHHPSCMLNIYPHEQQKLEAIKFSPPVFLFIPLWDSYWNYRFRSSQSTRKTTFLKKLFSSENWVTAQLGGWLWMIFPLSDGTREEAMCLQLLAYSLIATTPKAIEISVPLLGTCPHFPQSVLLFLEAFIHAAWGTGPGGAGAEEGGEARTGAEKWKDAIKENKEVTVECGSFTQEPFLYLQSPLTPYSALISDTGTKKMKKKRLILDDFLCTCAWVWI